MELYIGGYGQGKLEYVINNSENELIIDEQNFMDFFEKLDGDIDINNTIIWNHFNQCFRRTIEKENNNEASIKDESIKNASLRIKAFIENAVENNIKLIVISDEVGNGLIPVDEFDRNYREEVGRLQTYVAKESERVVRLVCGIAMRIK